MKNIPVIPYNKVVRYKYKLDIILVFVFLLSYCRRAAKLVDSYFIITYFEVVIQVFFYAESCRQLTLILRIMCVLLYTRNNSVITIC